MTEKYTVIVRQKKTWYGWKRDNEFSPKFMLDYSQACLYSLQYNEALTRRQQKQFRFIVISIDRV